MKVITWNGYLVEKPETIKHEPKLHHTIKPKKQVDYSTWVKHIRLRINDKQETFTCFYL